MTEINDGNINGSNIDEIFAQGILIDQAVKKAIQKAVWEHKQVGNPVAAWRDGKVVWLAPEDIEIQPNLTQENEQI